MKNEVAHSAYFAEEWQEAKKLETHPSTLLGKDGSKKAEARKIEP
jgi:hypothetical protein